MKRADHSLTAPSSLRPGQINGLVASSLTIKGGAELSGFKHTQTKAEEKVERSEVCRRTKSKAMKETHVSNSGTSAGVLLFQRCLVY